MKKLLSMAFCAAAVTTLAEDVTVATVGVTAITLPKGQQNTIIAASFTELATGENISIANIVKATNLLLSSAQPACPSRVRADARTV